MDTMSSIPASRGMSALGGSRPTSPHIVNMQQPYPQQHPRQQQQQSTLPLQPSVHTYSIIIDALAFAQLHALQQSIDVRRRQPLVQALDEFYAGRTIELIERRRELSLEVEQVTLVDAADEFLLREIERVKLPSERR